ncbi:MAG: HD domain-containing phosphohydrolase [Pusillimonas sp.]
MALRSRSGYRSALIWFPAQRSNGGKYMQAGTPAQAHCATGAALLIVDDEPNVVRSVSRSLRSRPFAIHTAHNGAEALEVMKQASIDLVLCDSRMPGMDGPTLLGEIGQQWPGVMRILFTGFDDNAQTIKAINEGRIFRYISKPWDEQVLIEAIDQALAFQGLERERARLLQLTHEQNEALQQANATLESRVEQRTAELLAATEQLSVANTALKQSYVTATELFSSLLSQRLPPSRKTNEMVIRLVREFCAQKKYAQKFTDDLVMAAALYNVGKLTWTDPLIALPPETMSFEQRQRYREYPVTGERLLLPLEIAHDAAQIIRHHQERWDGTGFPDALAGDAIPLGSRILKLAVDVVEIRMGMVASRKVPLEELLDTLPEYSGRLYDPVLAQEFVHMIREREKIAKRANESVTTHTTDSIRPDMVIARNLMAQDGMLLLREGTVITPRLIAKLQGFEENEGVRYTLHVLNPSFTPETPDDAAQ